MEKDISHSRKSSGVFVICLYIHIYIYSIRTVGNMLGPPQSPSLDWKLETVKLSFYLSLCSLITFSGDSVKAVKEAKYNPTSMCGHATPSDFGVMHAWLSKSSFFRWALWMFCVYEIHPDAFHFFFILLWHDVGDIRCGFDCDNEKKCHFVWLL